jgi:hypothetical protein
MKVVLRRKKRLPLLGVGALQVPVHHRSGPASGQLVSGHADAGVGRSPVAECAWRVASGRACCDRSLAGRNRCQLTHRLMHGRNSTSSARLVTEKHSKVVVCSQEVET